MGFFSKQPPRVQAMKRRLYDLIDKATSEFLSAPNYALNTDVASTINGAPDPFYASTKACKRFKLRLATKNPRVQQLTLQTLEHSVRSCGEAFHQALAQSELLGELVRLAAGSVWCPPTVQGHVLALFQEWGTALRPTAFADVLSRLRARGAPFPPPGTTAAAGGKAEPYPGLGPGVPGQPAPPYGAPPGPFGGGYPPQGAPVPEPGMSLLSPRAPPEKLRGDMEVARNTLAIFTEMLDNVPDDNYAAVKEDYITDMLEQVRVMKARLAALVERVADEGVMGEALELNDEAQRAIDRHSEMVEVADGRRPQPPSRVRAERVAAGAGVAAAASSVSGGPPPPAARMQQPLIPDLLSLDDWDATPAPANGGAPPPPFVDPFAVPGQHGSPAAAPPPTAPAPQMSPLNNPFAPASPTPSAASAASHGPAPGPSAASAPPAAEANPFLSDTAFAAVQPPPPASYGMQQQQQQPGFGSFGHAPSGGFAPPPSGSLSYGMPPPSATAPPASTGNPFAAAAPAPQPAQPASNAWNAGWPQVNV